MSALNMSETLLEPTILLGILFWWAVYCRTYWCQNQHRRYQYSQLDELFALVGEHRAGQIDEDGIIKRLARRPRWCALPQLRYAQIIKQCRRRRLVKLIQRVAFGHRDFQRYYHLCLPHASLRQSLPLELIDASDRGAQYWQKTTPAMATGLTDQVWRLRELLLFRVPPWQQPALE